MKGPHERIQSLRKTRGLTRVALAKKMKRSRLWVWRIETGTTKLSVELLPKFARALGCSVEDLVA